MAICSRWLFVWGWCWKVGEPSDAIVSRPALLARGRYGRTRLVNPVNLLYDLEDFAHDHRPHGILTGDATEPAWNGYLLTVACPCGWCLRGG
jgi:hypothetical protein